MRKSLRACLALCVATAIAHAMSAWLPSSNAEAPVRHSAGAGTNRVIEWTDTFDTRGTSTPNAKTWQAMTGGNGWGNNELEYYTSNLSNVYTAGGSLHIVARKQTYTGADGVTRDYTSARLMGRKSFRYGYLVARIKIPQGTGLWPAFWTEGANIRTGTLWPMTGEIDVMEAINHMTFVAGSLHGPDTSAPNWWDAYDITHHLVRTGAWWRSWHNYGVYWTSTAVTWYFDGYPFARVAKAQLPPNQVWAFDQPQVPLLDLAVGGNWPGAPDTSTRFPAEMDVDWVRLYNRPLILPATHS